MRRIDAEITRVSRGRLRFDVRRRELSTYDEAGQAETTLQISETELRNWLQRLLLADTPRQGLEPYETAILALVDRLVGTADVASRPPRRGRTAPGRVPAPVT